MNHILVRLEVLWKLGLVSRNNLCSGTRLGTIWSFWSGLVSCSSCDSYFRGCSSRLFWYISWCDFYHPSVSWLTIMGDSVSKSLYLSVHLLSGSAAERRSQFLPDRLTFHHHHSGGYSQVFFWHQCHPSGQWIPADGKSSAITEWRKANV